MRYCEFVKPRKFINENLECMISDGYCAFQRYCNLEGCVKHTDNFTTCVARRKEMEENKQNVVKSIALNPKAKKESTTKKYLVVLSCPKYIVYVDENGNNIQKNGNYNVKIGDYTEL